MCVDRTFYFSFHGILLLFFLFFVACNFLFAWEPFVSVEWVYMFDLLFNYCMFNRSWHEAFIKSTWYLITTARSRKYKANKMSKRKQWDDYCVTNDSSQSKSIDRRWCNNAHKINWYSAILLFLFFVQCQQNNISHSVFTIDSQNLPECTWICGFRWSLAYVDWKNTTKILKFRLNITIFIETKQFNWIVEQSNKTESLQIKIDCGINKAVHVHV